MTSYEENAATPAAVPAGVVVADAPEQLTVMVADIVNSTGIKETQTDTAWLKGTTFLYTAVYGALTSAIRGIAWVKFTGDGAMVVVPAEYAIESVNSAIELLERIREANRGRAGGKGEIDYDITVGVATGPAFEVTMPDRRLDYIGQTLDKASRLAGIASPNALLVDSKTVAAANTMLLTSQIGNALERPVEDYVGATQTVRLRGFTQAVSYHEVLWAKQFFGVKAEFLTSSTTQLEAARSEQPRQPGPAAGGADDARGGGDGGTGALRASGPARADRRTGTVKTWNAERGFGFVTDTTGEDFHVSPRHVVYQEDLPRLVPGQQVAFVAGDAGRGRCRQALAVLLAGSDAQGLVTGMPPGRDYGWIKVVDMEGNAHPVFMPLDGTTGVVDRSMVVDFIVRIGPRGAYAADVHRVDNAA